MGTALLGIRSAPWSMCGVWLLVLAAWPAVTAAQLTMPPAGIALEPAGGLGSPAVLRGGASELHRVGSRSPMADLASPPRRGGGAPISNPWHRLAASPPLSNQLVAGGAALLSSLLVGGLAAGFSIAVVNPEGSADGFGFGTVGLLSGLTTYALLAPALVYIAGENDGGDGQLWATYLASLLATAASSTLVGVGLASDEASSRATFLAVGVTLGIVGPLLGAMAGYELSRTDNIDPAPHRVTGAVVPFFGPQALGVQAVASF